MTSVFAGVSTDSCKHTTTQAGEICGSTVKKLTGLPLFTGFS